MMEKDAKIYVAGHRGMVGSAIVRELERQGYHNIVTRTHKELDLTRQDAVEEFFAQEKPEYVFLAAAKVGGIMAAKRTSELIPLCHPLPLPKEGVEYKVLPERQAVEALCSVKTAGVTGVEMEALTGVSTALLTIYDMCKAVDKCMELSGIHLVEKTGGKSGHYIRAEGGYV